MTDQVRVRYAPSPTGDPHVGNIRTAIFNWLFARHHGGAFVVRIEDTDQSRKVEGALENILEGLRWLGLDWDEGPDIGGPYSPYFQSERLEIYLKYCNELLEKDLIYPCYCSPERLKKMRRQQQLRKAPTGYDRRCREPEGREEARRESGSATRVLRFKMPMEGSTTFYDAIRGEVSFENRLLDDFVLLKSDGFPTYHLANIVDDHLMKISHVLRAEEWLSSAPRHLLLYQAFGWEPPTFAHLPIILGQDRSKLSKRHGAVSILEYKKAGYLPQVMLNFLALLGWSLDDKTEIISRDDLIKHFSLERIGKSGAIFNQEKLDWMNGYYIRDMRTEELTETLIPVLEDPDKGLPEGIARPIDRAYLTRVVPLIQERLKTLAEAPELTSFFFEEDLEFDSRMLAQKGMDSEGVRAALQEALSHLEKLRSFDAQSLEGALRPLAQELGLKTGQLFGCLRVAVTGRKAAPPLFETMETLGKERCLNRIKAAIGRLERA